MTDAPVWKYQTQDDASITLDTHISTIFSGSDVPDEKKPVLTQDLEKLLRLSKTTADVKLREFLTDFYHEQGMFVQEKKENGKIIFEGQMVPEEKLAELAHYSLTDLESQKLWHPAYQLVRYTGHVSMALGVAGIATAQRFMGKALSDKEHGSFGADPVDIMQGIDATLKGGVLTAYTLMRLAPHHEYPANEYGFSHAKHILQNLYHDTKGMGKEFIANPYLKQMWKMYAIIDLFLNLPGHILATGRPVEELKREAHSLLPNAEGSSDDFVQEMQEHSGGMVHNLLTHIPGVNAFYKDHFGHILNALPADIDTHKIIANATRDHVTTAIDAVENETYDKAHEHASRMDTHIGAVPRMRRQYFIDIFDKRDLSVVFGYLGKAGVAGLDALRLYERGAQKDQLFAATGHGFKNIGGT